MRRRVGENGLHMFNRQSKVLIDVGFIDAGFPVFDDVVCRHPCALQHGPVALHARLRFDERAPDQSIMIFLLRFSLYLTAVDLRGASPTSVRTGNRILTKPRIGGSGTPNGHDSAMVTEL
jgi:hypothetical protein